MNIHIKQINLVLDDNKNRSINLYIYKSVLNANIHEYVSWKTSLNTLD